MTSGDLPHEISLAELCRRCREEVDRYRRHLEQDGRFCFEVFRRAVVSRDQRC